MGSRIFELYRRAAMGNGDTGTPVPRPVFTIQDAALRYVDGLLSVEITVKNIGTGTGRFSIAISGYYIDTTDLANDEEGTPIQVNFTNPNATYLDAEATTVVYGGAQFGSAGRKGTVHADIVLTNLSASQPGVEFSKDGYWVYPGMVEG